MLHGQTQRCGITRFTISTGESSIHAEVCSHYQVHGAKIEVIYNGRLLSSSSSGRSRILHREGIKFASISNSIASVSVAVGVRVLEVSVEGHE